METPNPVEFETRAWASHGLSLPTASRQRWAGQRGGWQPSGLAAGAGSSHLLAANPSQDGSHIICLLTINKAVGVGCRELLRNHNAGSSICFHPRRELPAGRGWRTTSASKASLRGPRRHSQLGRARGSWDGGAPPELPQAEAEAFLAAESAPQPFLQSGGFRMLLLNG